MEAAERSARGMGSDGVGWGWMGVVVKLRIFSGMMAMAWLRWFAIGCDWKVDAPE